MTVTRTKIRACGTSDCPWRDDPENHYPWCGHIPDHGHTNVATHQHTVKRSAGGKEITALLCPMLHDAVDNGTMYSNKVIEYPALGTRTYVLMDRVGKVLIRRDLGAEGGADVAKAPPTSVQRHSAPPPAPEQHGEEGLDGRPDGAVRQVRDVQEGNAEAGHDTAPQGTRLDSGSVPTLLQEVAAPSYRERAERLAEATVQTPWGWGDLLNEADAEHGDDYSCSEAVYPALVGVTEDGEVVEENWTLMDFAVKRGRLSFGTVRNYQRVAAAYSATNRYALSFGHHQAAYKHPERDQFLKLAVAEGWTVGRLREALGVGKKPKARRWTLAELREAAAAFAIAEDIDLIKDDLQDGCIPSFLEWLGGAE